MTAFFPDIGGIIDQKLAELWAKIAYYVTFSFLDPFWGWLAIGICIIAAVCSVCWFFGSWFPVLRPIGGVIVMLVTFGLYAYRKGEHDARAHDKRRK